MAIIDAINVALILVPLLALAYEPSYSREVEISDKEPPRNSYFSICNSTVCHDLSDYLWKSVDTTVDPCDDFYNFACGKFQMYSHEYNRDIDKDTITDMLLKATGLFKVKFYDTPIMHFVRRFSERCFWYHKHLKHQPIQVVEMNMLKSMITEIGGMPLLHDQFNSAIPWWRKQAIILRKFSFINRNVGAALGVLINVAVDYGSLKINSYERNHFLVQWNKGNGSRKQHFFLDRWLSKIRKKNSTPDELKQLSDVLFFESRLYTLVTEPGKIKKKDITLAEVEKACPSVPWVHFFKEVFPYSSFKIRDSGFRFGGVDLEYLRGLDKLIKHTDINVLQNYLGLHVLFEFGNFVFDDSFGFYTTLQAKCLAILSEYLFTGVMERLFVDRHDFKKDVVNTTDLAENVQKGFVALIKKKPWLDDVTRSRLVAKIRAVEMHLGFPRWVLNNDFLQNFYEMHSEVDVETKSFLRLLVILTEHTVKEKYLEFLHPDYKSFVWSIPPFSFPSHASPRHNLISIPATYFIPPAYWRQGIKSMNYGGLGTCVGYELGHLVNTKGLKYDRFGNYRPQHKWWKESSYQEFETQKQALMNNYHHYKDQREPIQLNAKKTIESDIADNAAVRAAYYGYLISGRVDERLPGFERYDDRQLFFMTYANRFCTVYRTAANIGNTVYLTPHRFRAFLPLRNFDRFAQVFHCPKGSNMNPKRKAGVW